jgi:hypothetical protein
MTRQRATRLRKKAMAPVGKNSSFSTGGTPGSSLAGSAEVLAGSLIIPVFIFFDLTISIAKLFAGVPGTHDQEEG